MPFPPPDRPKKNVLIWHCEYCGCYNKNYVSQCNHCGAGRKDVVTEDEKADMKYFTNSTGTK